MINLSIFVSGAGSNADAICGYFAGDKRIRVALIVTDNPAAGVIEVAARHGIPAHVLPEGGHREPEHLLYITERYEINFIVLAGYLKLIPSPVTSAFEGRMVNIYPALLPAYGGRGMYGMRVHEAVIAAGESRSGITIHYVDERYDSGGIIFQAVTEVTPDDTPQSLAGKIHALEHAYFSPVIEKEVERIFGL